MTAEAINFNFPLFLKEKYYVYFVVAIYWFSRRRKLLALAVYKTALRWVKYNRYSDDNGSQSYDAPFSLFVQDFLYFGRSKKVKKLSAHLTTTVSVVYPRSKTRHIGPQKNIVI